MKCEHVGMNSAINCQKHEMTFSHGFPNHEKVEESKYEEIFGLYFPTGRELKYESEREMLDLCKNSETIDIWLDIIAKKPFLVSGYSMV